MSDELPQGWASTRVGDLFPSHGGGTPNRATAAYWNGNIPWLSSGDIKTTSISESSETITKRGLEESAARLCRKGSVLVVVPSGILKHTLPVAVLEREAAINQDIKSFDSGHDELNQWLSLAWRASARKLLTENREGTTVQSVKLETLNDFVLPLAPLAEQRRIVAKLTELLGKVDASQKRLAKISVLLKRFRQSVLAAACSGRLTADWREENPAVESGAEFVQRIQVARKRLWEEIQLQKMVANGRVPADERCKKRYEPPVLGSVLGRNDLPPSWSWEKLDAVLAFIESGKSFTCEERPPAENEVGVLKVSAVTWGEFDENESKTCKEERRINPDIQVRTNDFLFSRANTIELVGACVIVRKVSRKLMLSDKTLRLHFAGTPNRYVLCALRSQTGRAEIENLATGNQNSMRNIGQDRIREIVIPFPPVAEQQEIVQRVEGLFALADQLEVRLSKACGQVEKLTPSLLARAFAGKLVPQDPTDEPADKLLERIRATET